MCLCAALGLIPACSPKTPEPRGNLDQRCNPDGSCNSPLLECTEGELYLGIPMHRFDCEVKRKP